MIITASEGFTPLDPLRTADVADFPYTAPNIDSSMTAACTDDVGLAFTRLTNFVVCTLHKTLTWSLLYIGGDVSLEDWTVLRKFR